MMGQIPTVLNDSQSLLKLVRYRFVDRLPTELMDRDRTPYLVLHYGILLAAIFASVIVIDTFVTKISM
jgi:hypothetical protein